jgi:protein-tyrosine phosphatase
MADPIRESPRELLRRTLPASLLRAIRVFRDLTPGARAVLPRVWLRRVFGRTTPLPAGLPARPRVLFVCHGNILRSAMAEALLRSLGGAEVGSAGTAARDGLPADPRGIRVARELGVELDGHKARRLSPALLASADLVVVMDYLNEADVIALDPAATPKLRLLGSFDHRRGRAREIRDPFSGTEADVREAFTRIAEAVRSLATAMSLGSPTPEGNSRAAVR